MHRFPRTVFFSIYVQAFTLSAGAGPLDRLSQDEMAIAA